jgi:hypothetical protein
VEFDAGMTRSWIGMRLFLERVAIAGTNALLVGGGPGAAALLVVTTTVGKVLHRRGV